MMLLFIGSNTSSRAPNLIFTVQIVATRVSNLSSKFQLDQTTDEAGSTLWWNLGSEMCFSFLSSLLFFFFLFQSLSIYYYYYYYYCNWLGPQEYEAPFLTYEGAQQFSGEFPQVHILRMFWEEICSLLEWCTWISAFGYEGFRKLKRLCCF